MSQSECPYQEMCDVQARDYLGLIREVKAMENELFDLRTKLADAENALADTGNTIRAIRECRDDQCRYYVCKKCEKRFDYIFKIEALSESRNPKQ